MNEPRGGVFRHVNLLVPAKNPQAQMGFIVMEPEDTPPMSGSNSMCVSTVLLDTGITSRSWTYRWTAPTDPSRFSSFTFEFWCGDPAGTALTYPAELRRRIDMVASLPPPPTSPSSTDGRNSNPAAVTLPDTR